METSILIAEMFLKEAKKDIKEKKIPIKAFIPILVPLLVQKNNWLWRTSHPCLH